MLNLGTTSSKVTLTTGSAGQIASRYSYVDDLLSGPTFTPGGAVNADMTTATTADLVPVPASGTVRNVLEMVISNESTTVANLCSAIMTDGTNTSLLWEGTLQPKERAVFDENGVWTVYDSSGRQQAPSTKLDAKKYVSADVAFATAGTWADVTGLTQALQSGKKYCFEAHLYHISNATTTGAQFGYNIGAAPTESQISTIDTVTGSVTASAHSAGSVTARDTAATAQTTGSAAITMGILSGYLQPSADGTFAIRCASEVSVANGVIVKKGSWLRIWEVDS